MAGSERLMCDYVLKGCGFQSRHKALKINSGFSRRGAPVPSTEINYLQKEGHHE
jgi:hypothetical protein